ncbi:MAG TPA: isoprenylcysteine carboxylmethyltransferase family protein [Longimicrobium sp.]|nr:isoprenylcysteine carboxylmethyltransferase family protein [Longimicrobium sp.]
MTLLKTLLFTVLVPGTVAGVIPAWIRGGWRIHAPAWAALAGGAVLLVGAGIYLWCAWDFATAGRGTPLPQDPPRALVARGLYRFSRNPMYVGVVTAVVGQALWARSGGIAAYAAVLAAVFHLRVVRFEEPVLRRSFGADYERYIVEVPRWFGRPARTSPHVQG